VKATLLARLPVAVAAMLGGAILGLAVRAIFVLAHAARTSWWPAASVGALAAAALVVCWQPARAVMLRARVSKVTLKLGGSGAEVSLDPNSREQLWRFFIEMASRVVTRPLAAGDGLLEEALTSLYRLFDQARSDLSAHPPRVSGPGWHGAAAHLCAGHSE
jgi:hypothetical protein